MFKKSLESVVWELTLLCNAKCRHCGSSAGTIRDNELSLQESLKICEQLSALKCKRVNLMGGELFLNPHWKEIAKRLSDKKIKVSIITNGILLTKENLDFLKEINVETIGISIDGGLAGTHDSIRQVPGLFDKIFSILPYAKELNIPLSAITTLSKENIYELPILRDKLLNSVFDGWQFQVAAPYGRMKESLLLSTEEFYMASLFCAQTKRRFSGKLQINTMHDFGYYSKTIPLKKGLFSWTGCPAGKKTLGIRSDGKVHGCLSMYDDKFAEGDLRKESLERIFYSKNFCGWNKRFNKCKKLGGFCKECEYGLICLGGCSDISHAAAGGVWENPYCWHAVESRYKNLKPENEFERVFKEIVAGSFSPDGYFYLKSGQKADKKFIDSLKLEEQQKNLLKLLDF